MAAQRTAKGPTSWLEGRGIAIAVVVPLSLASFLLGYFVGKVTTEGEAPQVVTLAVPEAVEQTGTPPVGGPEDEALREGLAGPPADAPADASPAERAAPAPPRTRSQAMESEPPAGHEEPAPEPPSSAVPAKPDLRKRMPYSVQIAAFQNRRDAEDLQRKYLEKGYNVYVLQTRTQERKTVYKVRVGRFERRKDAELLALKLKTLEGLTPFVTVH